MLFIRFFISLVLFIMTLCLYGNSFALQEHDMVWMQAVIRAPVVKESKFNFYLHPRLRYIDDPYLLQQASLYAGLGYTVIPNLTFTLGGAWIQSMNTAGRVGKESRIFQQTDWGMLDTKQLKILSRTIIETRKDHSQSVRANRIRERLMLRIPIQRLEKYSFVVYDEGFFNLNHPSWVSHYTYAENRAFLGIGIQFTKVTSLDLGYLNQYQFNTLNTMNHVLLANLNVNL